MTHGHEVLEMMQGLIDFLKERGKFMPLEDGFTVDKSKVCNH